MAVIAPLAGELVLDASEGLGAGNLVQGAETIASQFKTQVLQGSIFGTAEGALFGVGEKLYHHIKQDLGFEKKQVAPDVDTSIIADVAPTKPLKKRKLNKRRKIG